MDKTPLVAAQIEAGERLIREFGIRFPVQAAFWLRERENDDWNLYLASDRINDTNFDLAYGEVLRILPPEQSPWIDPFQVKVVATDSPVAKAAQEVMKDYTGRIPIRYHGRQFGDLSADEVYIYLLPLPVSA